MDFELDEQHRMLQQTVREFATAQVAPHAAAWDEQGQLPASFIKATAELGVTGLLFPEAYGGGNGDMLSFAIALEELARADLSAAVTISVVVSLCGQPVLRYGSEEQRRRWLPPLLQGNALAAFALTEPGGGSDAQNIETRAEQADGGWVINGSKCFITNSGSSLTSFLLVAARTGQDQKGGHTLSNFIVPAGTAGLSVGPAYRKLGWRASDTHPVFLQNVQVPGESLLGAAQKGLGQFLSTLDHARVGIAAMAVGLAQASLDLAVTYAKQRRAFGRSLAGWQAIQFKLADMALAVDLARLSTYRAAWLIDSERPFKQEAAMAKLYATEAALRVVDEALQIYGGAGYMEDGPIARLYRDARVLTIGEGTSEVQRMVIARGLGC